MPAGLQCERGHFTTNWDVEACPVPGCKSTRWRRAVRGSEDEPEAGGVDGTGGWTVPDSKAERQCTLPSGYMAKYRNWKDEIQVRNHHPKEAAEICGDMHYEQLSGKNKGQFTIRLSQEHRVAFTLNTMARQVLVFHIGGHYP